MVTGRFDIWIRNPERAILEEIYEAVVLGELDAEDYLAWYAREIGLPSNLRHRDALATVIWRGNWRHHNLLGKERVFIFQRTVVKAADLDGPKLLTDMPRFRLLDAKSKALIDIDSIGPPSEDKVSFEVPATGIPGISDDELLVLRARQEGLSFAEMAPALSKKTGEPWSEQRVQAAKRQILRKKPLLKDFFTRERVYSNTGLRREWLPNGMRVYSLQHPDPYTATVIRGGIPVSATEKK